MSMPGMSAMFMPAMSSESALAADMCFIAAIGLERKVWWNMMLAVWRC